MEEKRSDRNQKKESVEQISDRIMREADIICCTLNSSGAEKMDRYVNNIDSVIVDEAC